MTEPEFYTNTPRAVFFASSRFSLPALAALRKTRCPPLLLITQPPASIAGSRLPQKTPPHIWADENRVPVETPGTLTDSDVLSALSRHRPDIFIIAAYGKILPQALLDIPKNGAINIHPSLLPKYRGPSPIQAAIVKGDTKTGVSLMLTDEKMDHGPILAQESFPITDPRMIAPQLESSLGELGAVMLIQTLPRWFAGEITPKPQAHEQATYTKLLAKEDGHIDWREPAKVIERKIRAYQPWPSAFTFWLHSGRQKQLLLQQASVIPTPAGRQPGAVFAHKHAAECGAPERRNAFAVVTGDGALCVTTLKPEGKKEMSSAAFLAGHPDIVGATLT